MKIEIINNHIQELQKEIEVKKQISNRYASIRFILLVFAFVCIYYGYHTTSLFYILLIMDIILFLWFASLHRNIKQHIEVLEATRISYQDIANRKGEEWKQFEDEGLDFLNKDTTQAYDLDIFGHASLFQYVSCAKTLLGREALASSLSCLAQSKEDILQRQEAIKEMAECTSFTMHFVALLKLFQKHGRKKKKATMESFFAYMEEEHTFYPMMVRIITILLPLATILSMVYAIAFDGSILYMSIFGVSSISIAMLTVMKNAVAFREVNILESTMHDYEVIFAHICSQDMKSAYLQDYKRSLKDASKALKKLNVIVNAIRFRNDGILFMVMNFLFLLDYQCVFALSSWKRQYGKAMRAWFHALAQYETIASMAQLYYAKEEVCTPIICEKDSPYIATKDVYHPLLCEKEAKSNTFEACSETYIVTGSNMSGKTTFLRTLGLNMVLFHAGAPVCGTYFEATPMNLYTSMRIKDDVSEGISTFYAEILRVKEMIEESKHQQPMMVCIDEIFKGTNSADRIICAKEVLHQLHLPHVITMVSTHDFELCELRFSNDEKAMNYHFSEFYEDDHIRFDYQLKQGRCKTTNAQELLKMAGINIDSVREVL